MNCARVANSTHKVPDVSTQGLKYSYTEMTTGIHTAKRSETAKPMTKMSGTLRTLNLVTRAMVNTLATTEPTRMSINVHAFVSSSCLVQVTLVTLELLSISMVLASLAVVLNSARIKPYNCNSLHVKMFGVYVYARYMPAG